MSGNALYAEVENDRQTGYENPQYDSVGSAAAGGENMLYASSMPAPPTYVQGVGNGPPPTYNSLTKNSSINTLTVVIRRGGPTISWGMVLGPAPNNLVHIKEVVHESAAAHAGIVAGDLLMEIDGVSVQALQGRVTATLQANGSAQTTLAIIPAATATPPHGEHADQQGFVDLQLMKKKQKDKWGLIPILTPMGYICSGVTSDRCVAYLCGIRPGDRIVAINGVESGANGTGIVSQLSGTGCALAVKVMRRAQWLPDAHGAGSAI